MTIFKLILVFTTISCGLFVECKLSDKRLCGNPECTEVIAFAKSLRHYSRAEEGMLSFPPNAEFKIYSDAAGSNMNLLGAEFKGKRGYIPSNLIRETRRIKTKDKLILVETEIVGNKNVPSLDDFKPSKTEPLVVDGTTIYNDVIEPSITQKTLSSSTPHGNLKENIVPNFTNQKNEVENKDEVESFENEHLVQENPTEGLEVKETIEAGNTLNKLDDTYVQSKNVSNISESPSDSTVVVVVEKPSTERINDLPDDTQELKNDSIESTGKNVKTNNSDKNALPNTSESSSNTIDNTIFKEVGLESQNEYEINQVPIDKAEGVFSSLEESINAKVATDINAVDDDDEQSANVEEIVKSLVENLAKQEEAKLIEADSTEVPNVLPSNDLPDKLDELQKIEGVAENQNNTLPIEDDSTKITLQTLMTNGRKNNENKDFVESVSTQDIINNIPPIALFKNVFSNNDADPESIEQDVYNNQDNIATSETTLKEINDNDSKGSDTTLPTSINHNSSPKRLEEENYGVLSTVTTSVNENPSSGQEEQLEEENDELLSTVSTSINQNAIYGLEQQLEEKTDDVEPTLSDSINENPTLKLEEQFEEKNDDVLLSKIYDTDHTPCTDDPSQEFCLATTIETLPSINLEKESISLEEKSAFNIFSFVNEYQLFLLSLAISGASIVVFLWGYMLIDKMKKVGPLIAKINNLEKSLTVLKKENEVLIEKNSTVKKEGVTKDQVDSQNSEAILELKVALEEAVKAKTALAEQVQNLEKDLENSAEVGLELNKMLTEVLTSQNGNTTVTNNIEQLQRQLIEQQSTINTTNMKLKERETENHELQLELEINNKKIFDLQAELDKTSIHFLKIEEEKELFQNKYDIERSEHKISLEKLEKKLGQENDNLVLQIQEIRNQLCNTERTLELKVKEYNLLKEATKNSSGSKDEFDTLLNNNSLKAEIQQLQSDNKILEEKLRQNMDIIKNYESQLISTKASVDSLKEKYEIADREKLEAFTKLDVLSSYFKEKEAELQKELNKHESMWLEKKGETSSATERIRFLQGEVQNFKSQYESLKQELISQEVEYKSQISVLDKKAHENWVAARQAERKFEDARQEAAQLRNRLTLRERNITEDKMQNRIPLPLETNGEIPMSPLHMNETAASPPLLFPGGRDLTTSPPLAGLHPLLPPPPGMPFMPPPPIHGLPPFMPPPPGGMFPGDHRPPPLGRMSSPPINRRYSPDLETYPYDRNSPSPTDEEYYDHSRRTYSPYNGRDRDRRDYNRAPPPPPQIRNHLRNHKGTISSGSANSNESLENISRHNSKV